MQLDKQHSQVQEPCFFYRMDKMVFTECLLYLQNGLRATDRSNNQILAIKKTTVRWNEEVKMYLDEMVIQGTDISSREAYRTRFRTTKSYQEKVRSQTQGQRTYEKRTLQSERVKV